MRLTTFGPLSDEFDDAAKKLARMLREIDRNLEGCRLLLDRVQPPYPGRIEMRWWLKARNSKVDEEGNRELPSYLKPFFTKLAVVRTKRWSALNAKRHGRSVGKERGQFRWYPKRVEAKYLTTRVRKNRGFYYCWPLIEDVVQVTIELVRAREEVVKAMLVLSATQRRLMNKHDLTVSLTRTKILAMERLVAPFLRPFPGPNGYRNTRRPVIDPTLLQAKSRILTRHGLVAERDLRARLSETIDYPYKSVFAVPEDRTWKATPSRDFPKVDPVEVPESLADEPPSLDRAARPRLKVVA